MKTFTTVVAIGCFSLFASHAVAQNRAITAQDTLGNWTLTTTPEQGSGVSITTNSGDGPLIVPVSITRSGNALTCHVESSTSRCEIRNGRLVITSRQSDATMIFTLNNRSQAGFTGETRLRLPVLPVGSVKIGSLRMTRQ